MNIFYHSTPSSPSTSMPIYEKHPEIYFPDGNIILAVRYASAPPSLNFNGSSYLPSAIDPSRAQSNTVILFRVYKGLMSKYSSVFEDLFSLPCTSMRPDGKAGEIVNETYEDVPLALLTESKEELESLLNFIFCHGAMKVELQSNFPIDILPLMSMAHKYEVAAIRKVVLEQFYKDWPTSLITWEQRNPRLGNAVPEPAAAIMFAERFDMRAILPAAMYELSRSSFNKSWKDLHFIGHSFSTSGWTRWELLSANQLLELGKLRENIESTMCGVYKRIFSVDHRPGIKCSSWYSDQEILDNLRLEAEAEHMEENTRDFLSLLKNTPQNLTESKLCERCKDRIHERCRREMMDLWSLLERMFNPPK